MPPATAAIAVLFSRNHNWIAKRLKLINEGGYYYTDESDTGAVQATDNLIFGRARLINTYVQSSKILA